MKSNLLRPLVILFTFFAATYLLGLIVAGVVAQQVPASPPAIPQWTAVTNADNTVTVCGIPARGPYAGFYTCFTVPAPYPLPAVDHTLATLRWFLPPPTDINHIPVWQIEYTHDLTPPVVWKPATPCDGWSTNAFTYVGDFTAIVSVGTHADTFFRMHGIAP